MELSHCRVPLKKIIIGTFELEPIDMLILKNVEQCELLFMVFDKKLRLTIRPKDVSRLKQHYSDGSNYLDFKFRPAFVEYFRRNVPEALEFKFNSKNREESQFVLQLDDRLSQSDKGILANFFCDVIPIVDDDSEADVIFFGSSNGSISKKEADLIPAQMLEANLRSRVKDVNIDITDVVHNLGPTPSKKQKSDNEIPVEDPPLRNLRSRNQNNNSRQKQAELDDEDYSSSDEDLRRAIELSKMEACCSEKPDSNMNYNKTEPCLEPCVQMDMFDKSLVLLQYPRNEGGVIIGMEDYFCLSKQELLNNIIIDFYLQYIYNQKLTEEQRARTHIYRSHFYSLYATSSNFNGWKEGDIKDKKAIEKRYLRVSGLPENDVNIFDKDFIVIPVNSNEHWYLAIICYPRLMGSFRIDDNTQVFGDDASRARRDDNQPPLKTSCVLIFDSVKGSSARRATTMRHIKDFLHSEWDAKYKDQMQFIKSSIITNSVKCPQQSNATDCGLFLLEFMERFFVGADPIVDFRLPLDKSDWFDPKIVKHKRKLIAMDIQNLMHESGNGELIKSLPPLSFWKDSLSEGLPKEVDNNNELEFNNNNDNYVMDNNNGNVGNSADSQNEAAIVDNENISTSDVLITPSEFSIMTQPALVLSPKSLDLLDFDHDSCEQIDDDSETENQEPCYGQMEVEQKYISSSKELEQEMCKGSESSPVEPPEIFYAMETLAD